MLKLQFLKKIQNKKQRVIPSFLFIAIFSLILSLPVYSEELALTDYTGKVHKMGDYKGKWVVINYWATWCPPCLKEIPMLSDYHDSHDNVQIFGVHYEKKIPKEKLQDFMDTYLISYPIIPLTRKLIARLGDATALPMTIFISPKGTIVKKYTGMLTKTFLDRTLK